MTLSFSHSIIALYSSDDDTSLVSFNFSLCHASKNELSEIASHISFAWYVQNLFHSAEKKFDDSIISLYLCI